MDGPRSPQFEQLRPRLIKWLIGAGLLLSLAVVATVLTYGEEPVVATSETQRGIIANVGGIALVVVVLTGGMLAYEQLIRKFSSNR